MFPHRSPFRARWPRLARLTPLALCALLPLEPLSAQRPEHNHDEDSEPGSYRVFTMVARPRLGLVLENQADKDKDKVGATIREVMEDSPAEKAGLKKGDIVTRFNGTALGGVDSEDEDQSGPAQKLMKMARKLDAGDTVELEYRRGSETKKVTLVAQDLKSPLTMTYRGGDMRMPKFEMRTPEPGWRMEAPGPDRFEFFGKGWGRGFAAGLNLIDLNPDLGEYFGAKEGVLVTDVPESNQSPLKAGDVILAIDGRASKSAEHAFRILGSYSSGETVKLDIMRKQKRQTVTWTVPEEKEGGWKMHRPGRPAPAGERT